MHCRSKSSHRHSKVRTDSKNKVWGRKKSSKTNVNSTNLLPVYLNERLAKRGTDLNDYAPTFGMNSTTENCVPKVFIPNATGRFVRHKLVDMKDLQRCNPLKFKKEIKPGNTKYHNLRDKFCASIETCLFDLKKDTRSQKSATAKRYRETTSVTSGMADVIGKLMERVELRNFFTDFQDRCVNRNWCAD